MTTATIDKNNLIITVEGLDKLLAFKGSITIPLSHIENVEHNTEPLMDAKHAAFGIGTIFAGRIQAGTFKDDDGKSFWDVRDAQKAILITLGDDDYSKLIIEVEDRDAVIAQIQTAVQEAQK